MTTVKGTLNVDEAVTLDSSLDVTGDTSVSTLDSSGATSLATGGGVVNIASSGVMTTVKGTLNVDQAVGLDSTLEVTGNVNVGTLQNDIYPFTVYASSGNTEVAGTLDVTGDTSVSTFDSTGATSLATGGGVVNIASTGVMTTVKGTLNVDEAVTLDTTLDVTGAVNINNTTQSTSKTTGALIVDGGMGVNNDIYIGGNINIAGDSEATNHVSTSDRRL